VIICSHFTDAGCGFGGTRTAAATALGLSPRSVVTFANRRREKLRRWLEFATKGLLAEHTLPQPHFSVLRGRIRPRLARATAASTWSRSASFASAIFATVETN
jgi:hypothetical protein